MTPGLEILLAATLIRWSSAFWPSECFRVWGLDSTPGNRYAFCTVQGVAYANLLSRLVLPHGALVFLG